MAADALNAAAAREYKLLKEAHVTGHNGGTIWETNMVTLAAPASVFLWAALQSRLSAFTPYTMAAVCADFLLNCVAILFATTLYSSRPEALNTLLIAPALLITLTQGRKSRLGKPRVNGIVKSEDKQNDLFPVKPFVTAYRGTMIVVTCVAILAVDFHAFPRRFAKVENWGTSLMDLGVGSFVFSAGTVSVRPILKQRQAGASSQLSTRLKSAARHAFPLFILGLVRLYSVKGLDYAEHVSEYGVHWNFFFTLAFIPPFVAVFDYLFERIIPSYALLAFAVALGYELVLDNTNLKAFIFTADRTDFLSQNREGIFSLFGYLAIFLAGQGTGVYILPRAVNTSAFTNPVLQQLFIWTSIWWSLYWVVTDYKFSIGLQVSRRLANLPYVLWVAAFNTGQILLFALVDTIHFPHVHDTPNSEREKQQIADSSSRLLKALNANGLSIFLIANLLTGLVNLVVPTLQIDDLTAVAILLGYMGLLSLVALTMDAFHVSIKL